jgi:hypothetical protein
MERPYKRKRLLNLKVYRNKSNGQFLVHLPKKIMKVIPSMVKVEW